MNIPNASTTIDKNAITHIMKQWKITEKDAHYVIPKENTLLQISMFLGFIVSVLSVLFLPQNGEKGEGLLMSYMALIATSLFFIYDFAKFKSVRRSLFKREVYLLKNMLENDLDPSLYYKHEAMASSQKNYVDNNIKNWVRTLDFSKMRHMLIANLIEKVHVAKAIDLGCGSGQCQDVLTAHSDSAYGVDLNLRLLRTINQKNFYTCQASVEKLPFGKHSFDMVLCLEVLEHVLYPHVAMREIGTVLKSNGIVILSTPNRNYIPLRFFLNPIKLVNQFLAVWLESLLGPKPLIGFWGPAHFFHTAYSIKELQMLFKQENLRIKLWSSYGMMAEGMAWALKIKPSVRQLLQQLNELEQQNNWGEKHKDLEKPLHELEAKYATWLMRCNIIFQKIPLIKLLGPNHLIIAEKA
jgi:2-polyprenyl-3-methyl-5-hydroxy-6-metoxy-1,4-benzoquinol methylase